MYFFVVCVHIWAIEIENEANNAKIGLGNGLCPFGANSKRDCDIIGVFWLRWSREPN